MDQVTESRADQATEADLATIKSILPHRYPFLLVDRVRGIEGTTRAQGIKNVTANEPHFEGHFPAEPIMPGVLIIEAMAQTAAVMIGVGMDPRPTGALVYFMSVDNAKFRRKVVPGDRLVLDVETLRGRRGGKAWRFRGTGTVDGEIAAEAEFMAMIDMKGA